MKNFKDYINESKQCEEFSKMQHKAIDSGEIDKMRGNTYFVVTFDYKGYSFNCDCGAKAKEVERNLDKIRARGEITDAYSYEGGEEKIVKLSDCSNFDYEIK